MSIFKRKIVNENKINSNKGRPNENESVKRVVKRVVIPDFSKTNFYDISPDQMEIFIRQAFELASIDEKQLIAMTLDANKLYQKLTTHFHIDAPYRELDKIFENAIESGTLTIGTESIKLDMTERGQYIQFLEGISGLEMIYRDFQHLFEKNSEVQ
jgi:helix-turn-helix protein